MRTQLRTATMPHDPKNPLLLQVSNEAFRIGTVRIGAVRIV